MDIEVLKSYLVSLGFSVDQPQLRKFDQALKDAADAVESSIGGIAGQAVKVQLALTGVFTGISSAVVGLADRVAMADQSYRLFGLRMFMSADQARKLKIGMDALGASMEEIAWDPELRARFLQLSEDQDRMAAKLGADFKRNMRSIRDMRFEFTRLHVELQYLSMEFVSSLFKALGTSPQEALEKFREFNRWLQEHGPQIAGWLARNLVPMLEVAWDILKGLGEALLDAGVAFTNLVGLLSGDDSIEGATFDFEKLGKAVQHVAGFFKELNDGILSVEETTAHLVSGLSLLASGKWSEAGKEFKAALEASGATKPSIDLTHPLTRLEDTSGTDTHPQLHHLIENAQKEFGAKPSEPSTATTALAPGSIASQAALAPGSIASQARELAIKAGAELGVNPRLIFEQWQHETGNFASRLARELNNLGGVRMPGSLQYRKFDSLDDYERYYVGLMRNKYTRQGLLQARNEEEWAGALKRGGYYEAPYQEYVQGMKGFARQDADLFRQALTTYNRDSLQRDTRAYQRVPPELASAATREAAGQTVTVGDIQINITQPNASPEQIQAAVTAGITDAWRKQTQRNLAQLAYVG